MDPPLIIAGAGYTGTRLARRQRARHPVAIVSGAASARRLEAFGIDARAVDLDAAMHVELSVGPPADVVYLVPPAADDDHGDRRLEAFLAGLGVARRFVYLSTTGVYGDAGGGDVDEETPPAPSSARSRRRVAAERIVRRWCEAHGAAWIILRVPGIYGPWRLQIRTLASGRPVVRREDAGPGNRIHVDDLVLAIEAALGSDRCNRIYNVGDSNPMTQPEFLDIVAGLTGMPAPVEVPMTEALREFDARRLSFVTERRRVDCRRIATELGFAPRYADPRDGIAASLVETGELAAG